MFDNDEYIIEAYANDPWGKSARSLCREPDNPPIRIGNLQRNETGKIISQSLPKYFEFSDPLCLKEALWNLWSSREAPLGVDLPILSAGVESIITGWFRTEKSTSKGVFMEKAKLESLLKEEIEGLSKRLEGKPNGNEIMNKVLRANEFGIMERYRKFFEELKLQVSEEEWDAINSRHAFVHGEVLFDKTNWEEVVPSS